MSQTVSMDWMVVHIKDGARKGTLAFDFVCDVKPHNAVNIGSADLNIEMFAVIRNSHDADCLTQEGGTIVSLAELMSATLPVTRPLLCPQRIILEKKIVKGLVNIRLRGQPTLGGKPLRGALAALQTKLEAYNDAEHLDWVPDYIDTAIRVWGPIGTESTFSALKFVNTFEWTARVGLLPAAAYFDVPLSYTSEEFFYNASLLALKGRGFTEQQALAWQLTTNKQDASEAAFWLADVLSLYPQYSEYRTDQVIDPATGREIEVEWFQYPQCSDGSGDCEDYSTVPLILSRDLDLIAQPRYDLVRLLKRVKSAYYVVMLLDGVTSNEVNTSRRTASDIAAMTHMSAHMNSALWNRRALNTILDSDTLAQARKQQPQWAGALSEDEMLLFEKIVMMEGTGCLESNGRFRKDTAAEARLNAMFTGHYSSLAHAVRKTYFYGVGYTEFYAAVKLMLTPELSDTQFVWIIEPRNAGTAGTTFASIASGSPDLVARAQTAFSERQMFDMRYAKRNCHPVPALEPPSKTTESETVRAARAAVDRMMLELQRLPGYSPSEPSATSATTHYSRILIKNQHMARPAFAERLQAAIATSVQHHGLVHVSVLEQQITPSKGGFRLRIYWAL